MKNTTQRILLFSFAVPAIIAIILFVPYWNHATISLVLVLASAGAAWELSGMLQAKGIPVRRRLNAFIGGLLPLIFWVATFFHKVVLPGRTILLGSALLLLLLLGPFAFARAKSIEGIVPEVLGLVFTILYPGLLAGYIILIASSLRQSTEALLTFAALTLGNDSLAWFFGVTMGKKRNLVAVSPNKSFAGFAGGILGSIGLTFLAAVLFPKALPLDPAVLAFMGLAVGIATIVGDLFESALKRSSGVKDSGRLIPGRGGFLDSIDSILFAAPVFYAFCLVFGLFS